jgi:ankyrin repeat protein
VSASDRDGHTPLHVWLGDVEIAKMLLKFDANTAATDGEGSTPAMLAQGAGYYDLAKMLSEDAGEDSEVVREKVAAEEKKKEVKRAAWENEVAEKAAEGKRAAEEKHLQALKIVNDLALVLQLEGKYNHAEELNRLENATFRPRIYFG